MAHLSTMGETQQDRNTRPVGQVSLFYFVVDIYYGCAERTIDGAPLDGNGNSFTAFVSDKYI